MVIRFAKEEELSRVNELGKQVNDLHVEEKTEVFKAGFYEELKNYIYTIWKDPNQEIFVAETDGMICGFAVLHHMVKAETPYRYEQDFMTIDEFGVDEAYRRKGLAREMISFIRDYTKEKGIKRLEMNVWDFNQGAIAFYEEAGFTTYRRHMEMFLE